MELIILLFTLFIMNFMNGADNMENHFYSFVEKFTTLFDFLKTSIIVGVALSV